MSSRGQTSAPVILFENIRHGQDHLSDTIDMLDQGNIREGRVKGQSFSSSSVILPHPHQHLTMVSRKSSS